MSEGMDPGNPTPIAEWERAISAGTYEEVFLTLEAVVARLEAGRLPLEESVTCYEIGVRLAERCERMLTDAELRVSRLDDARQRIGVDALLEDEPDAE